jgi:acyl dehydratase
MTRLYFEDFKTGTVTLYGPRRVTRDEIIDFATAYDPQPQHLDEVAARDTMLGGLCASGWHTCCLMMRLIADGFVNDSASMGAPGVEEIRWLAPLRPDTEIRVRATVLETRASATRPDRGFIKFLFEVIDPRDAVLMALTSPLMIERRSSAGAT